MSQKILYISYDGMTDPLGQSQVLPYLVSLSAQGYRFTILSFEKKARFQKEKAVIMELCERSGIKWEPLIYTRTPPVLSKIYDRRRMKQTALRLFREQQFAMIHCRSYVAAETGLWLKRKFGTKFLFDMRGFWADEKVDNGQWNQQNPFFRFVYHHYKRKEKSFLKEADGIISLTGAARSALLSWQGNQSLQIDVIPCCADLVHFNFQNIDAANSSILRQKLGISAGQKVITYLGSLGGWYMTKEMFAFFKRLLEKHPEFVMLVLTKDDPEMIQQQVAAAGLPSEKIIARFASRNELPAYISLSDCSIFFIRPTFSKIASSPTKHAELMGMGIPVICNDIGDTGSIINKTKTGLLVNEFTDAAYDSVIEKMDELLAIPKEKIRQAAFDYFDLEKGSAAYLSVYKRILD